MDNLIVVFQPGVTWKRSELSILTGKTDRSVRASVRDMRRAGIPILPLKEGGYKLAETPEEKARLLNMYRSRALDELTTYSKLLKTMQIDGQEAIADIIVEVLYES